LSDNRLIVAHVDNVGICENCGTTLAVASRKAEARLAIKTVIAGVACPRCQTGLAPESFGYEQAGDGWRKARWVDEKGRWAGTGPAHDFMLGMFFVTRRGIEQPVFATSVCG